MAINRYATAEEIKVELQELTEWYETEQVSLVNLYHKDLQAIQDNCPHNEGFNEGRFGRFCKICGGEV